MHTMLLQLLDFLTSRQYIPLFQWAKYLVEQTDIEIPENYRNILELLHQKNIPTLLILLEKLKYTSSEYELYALIVSMIQKDHKEILRQLQFMRTFEASEEYLNIILDKNILVFQETEEAMQVADPHEYIKKLNVISNNTQKMIVGGKICNLKGLSSINQVQALSQPTELQAHQKYEKIVRFIDGLNANLQNMLSIYQIAIIIYQDELYLIKWVQFLNEQQLISGGRTSTSSVAVLEEFGVKIGVQLKANLELGNLVIFKNRDESKAKDAPELEPLLALDQEIFHQSSRKASKSSPRYDLANPEDAQIFIDGVLARIETGILLLSKKKSEFLKDVKDADLYIKISLERIEGMDSLNQRINILRDLLLINQNPDNIPKIKAKLEINYIRFIKEQFQLRNHQNTPFLIKTIGDLGLFSSNTSLLIHTVVHLFDLIYIKPETILKTVECLMTSWTLSDELILALEQPQVVAITNTVINLLNHKRSAEVVPFLIEYLKAHTHFRSFNVLTLLLNILGGIFQKRHQTQEIIFSNSRYIQFLTDFMGVLHTHADLNSKDKVEFTKLFQEIFTQLTGDVEFIGFLGDKTMVFLLILQELIPKYISQRKFFLLLQKFAQLTPLVMFHKVLPASGIYFFQFLLEIYQKNDVLTEFSVHFIRYLTQSKENLAQNQEFFKKILGILTKIKTWITQVSTRSLYHKSIKKEVHNFLTSWYLSGELPEQNFAIHRKTIEEWIEFAGLQDRIDEMINIIAIKDFGWVCDKNDLKQLKAKYKKLPDSVFAKNREEIIGEFIRLLKRPFSTVSEFHITYQIFQMFYMDIKKFELSSEGFQEIRKHLSTNMQVSLIQIIHEGKAEIFHKIVGKIGKDVIFLPLSFFKKIFSNFEFVSDFTSTEAKRFNARLSMMKDLTHSLTKLQSVYAETFQFAKPFFPRDEMIITPRFIQDYLAKLNANSINVFQSAQRWLLEVSSKEFISIEIVITPIKKLFTTILHQFESDQNEKIIEQLQHLSLDFFTNQKMLNINKKNYFFLMIDIISPENYPKFSKTLKKHHDYISELAAIEPYYFGMRSGNLNKIVDVKKRSKKLIEINDQMFSPLLFYGTAAAIQNNYEEAIVAYENAMQFDSSQPNLARLYHNLLVSYLTTNRVKKAVALVKKLPLGVKTYFNIINLIHSVEQLSGERLIQTV